MIAGRFGSAASFIFPVGHADSNNSRQLLGCCAFHLRFGLVIANRRLTAPTRSVSLRSIHRANLSGKAGRYKHGGSSGTYSGD